MDHDLYFFRTATAGGGIREIVVRATGQTGTLYNVVNTDNPNQESYLVDPSTLQKLSASEVERYTMLKLAGKDTSTCWRDYQEKHLDDTLYRYREIQRGSYKDVVVQVKSKLDEATATILKVDEIDDRLVYVVPADRLTPLTASEIEHYTMLKLAGEEDTSACLEDTEEK